METGLGTTGSKESAALARDSKGIVRRSAVMKLKRILVFFIGHGIKYEWYG
jgi:hypothetical protein